MIQDVIILIYRKIWNNTHTQIDGAYTVLFHSNEAICTDVDAIWAKVYYQIPHFSLWVPNTSTSKTAHLESKAKIRNMLSLHDAEKLSQAFVMSRLDYCNVLLAGWLPCCLFNEFSASSECSSLHPYQEMSTLSQSYKLHRLPITIIITFHDFFFY